jgi:putative endonuclease
VYVYILGSKSRTLYVGVTNNLERRMYEHVSGACTFTARYAINRLLYYEEHDTPIAAIEREKRIKAMLRERKISLIEANNPAWDDLADGWFGGAPGRRA